MSRRVGDDLVILDVESSNYFGLNDVGAVVWERLEHDATRTDIIDVVVNTFDVDRERAMNDVGGLIEQLLDAGLVVE